MTKFVKSNQVMELIKHNHSVYYIDFERIEIVRLNKLNIVDVFNILSGCEVSEKYNDAFSNLLFVKENID